MAITTSCSKCGRTWRVSEDKAGMQLKCKECGATFVVGGSASDSADDEFGDESRLPAARRRRRASATPRRSKGRSRRSARNSGNSRNLLIAGSAAGVVLIGVAVGLFVWLSGGDDEAEDTTTGSPAIVEPGSSAIGPWKPLDGWAPDPQVAATLKPVESLPGIPELQIRLPQSLELGRQTHPQSSYWKLGWRGTRRSDGMAPALIVAVNKIPAAVNVTNESIMRVVNTELSNPKSTLSRNWSESAVETGNAGSHTWSRKSFSGIGAPGTAEGRIYWTHYPFKEYSFLVVAMFLDSSSYTGTTLPPLESAVLSIRLADNAVPASDGVAAQDLVEARRGFSTKLVRQAPAPQEYENEVPPPGVTEVRYTSGDLTLKAWLSNDPGDGHRHPAVVFLHGGWAFGAADWRDASPYRDAGFVVMMPMLRGENGNSGHFELLYGEVDDAIAAGKFLADLNYVNPDRVFVVGHSSGAMLCFLVAMMPSRYKAAGAFSGSVDHAAFIQSEWRSIVPYDQSDPMEIRLRNPMQFVSSLRCPLYVFMEPQHSDFGNNRVFVAAAKQAGKTCEFYPVNGDHWTMVAASVQKTIEIFGQGHVGESR